MKIYKSASELIGNTPILELCNIEKEFNLKSGIFAKMEYFNPAGSVKDRVAKKMLDEAQKQGRLTEDTVIIEPTSGNTGIGLACVAASRGLKMIIVMPDNMSEERQKIMKAYGAELVLTDGKKGMAGAIEKAKELNNEIKNSIIAGQFENPDNPKAHFETTGPEIYSDMDGNIDCFVAGIGTGGTITGVGQYLKMKNPAIKIVGIEPESSAVLSGGKAGAHKLQGIGAGFIPKVLDRGIYDKIITVSDEDAYAMTRLVCKKEGIMVGISSGAALWGAVSYAKENENENIAVLLPDTGSRYLSQENLF